MLIPALVDAFLAWCRRHRAPATADFYADRLKTFRAKYPDRAFGSLTSLEVDEYLFAAGQGRSPSTQRHNAVALQTLQSFALREKLLERPVFDRLEKPRGGRRERIPSPAEIARLLAGAPPAFALVYRALLQCGARPGELCRLSIEEHVDWTARVITIAEHKTARKTGRPRKIPIGQKLQAILQTAIGARTAGPVFLTARGRRWTAAHLSALHRQLRDSAGLPDDLVLYLARHRFGTELARRRDIKVVADLMGHAAVTTTERYIHRDVAELADDQDLV